MMRDQILDAAKEYVTVDRAATHGGAEDSFAMIADLWNAYLGLDIKPHDVCAMMALMKIGRIAGNPAHTDSWVDVAGYACLGGEISSQTD
jgi:hypothetical protein